MSVSKPDNEAKRIAALQRYRILDTAPEQSFDDFAQIASLICQAPIANVTFVDSDRQWFKAKVGSGSSETPREHAFCAYTILGTETMVVEDATADERFARNPLVTHEPHIRFYAGAPLIDREGNALGSICVIDRKSRALTPDQSMALTALSRRVIEHMELRIVSLDLAEALAEMKTMHGLLPICAYCKGIRDDEGYWQAVENYLSAHTEADFSHGICPECFAKHYPEIYAKHKSKGT